MIRKSIIKNEMDDLFTDTHSILSRWRKHFSQLLNEHRVNEVRQTGKPTAEQIVPAPSIIEMKI